MSSHHKTQSFVLAWMSTYWLLQGPAGCGCRLLVGSRSTPGVSYLPRTSGLSGAYLHREVDNVHENKLNQKAGFKPLLASHLLTSCLVEPKVKGLRASSGRNCKGTWQWVCLQGKVKNGGSWFCLGMRGFLWYGTFTAKIKKIQGKLDFPGKWSCLLLWIIPWWMD